MTVASPTPNIGYRPRTAPRPPIWRRINLRMILFVAVAVGIVAYPVYVFLDNYLTGGIKNVGNGYKEVDIKAMSMFAFDPGTSSIDDIPKKWRDLDGQKVILYGEQWNAFNAGAGNPGVRGFELCYSIAKCCFGGPPKIQHFVHCTTLPKHTVDYFGGAMVKAVGTLHVHVERDPGSGFITGIYFMDVESVDLVD
jgi:hypothetical protein